MSQMVTGHAGPFDLLDQKGQGQTLQGMTTSACLGPFWAQCSSSCAVKKSKVDRWGTVEGPSGHGCLMEWIAQITLTL